MTTSPDIHSTLLDAVLVYLFPGEALGSLDFPTKGLNVTQGQARLEVQSRKRCEEIFFMFLSCV